MALIVGDRVKETTTTTGTGAFTLAGAVNGYAAFSSRLNPGDITFYAAVLGTQWEVGFGTLADASTLQRTAVFASSQGDAAVNFVAGTKEVFIDFPAYLADRLADFAIAEATVASAATVDLGAANSRKVAISGTAVITSFGTRAHREKLLRFTGACTLTQDATALILPTGANIRTAAGDTALATSDANGNWRVRHYQRGDGTPLAAGVALDDFRSLAVQVAKLKGSVAGLFGGVVDDFRDQTGYDTANSVGATYDATNNLITNGSADTTTKALLHFDGSNGSTTFTDDVGHTFTATGAAKISTAQSVFGGASLQISGNGDSALAPASADFAPGTGDFTVNARLRAASIGSLMVWLDQGADGQQTGFELIVTANGQLSFYSRTDGATLCTGSTVLSANTWYDVEISRASGTIRIFLNGNIEASASSASNFGSSQPLRIGSQANGAVAFVGFIDEFRYSNVARHTAPFTPAASAFSYSSGPAPLDLRSVAFTAQAVPTKGSIYILVKATAGTLTPGTNFTASMTRDGGTTYAPFALTQTGTVAGYLILEANGLDISSQPSGTSMKWRIQTVGTALSVAIDAVVAQWG